MTAPRPAPPRVAGRRGLGALLTTEVEHADLGTHAARRLRARVQRRQVQLALGTRRQFRLNLGRLRPVAVEVYEQDASYELPIVVPPTPWVTAARRLLLWWGATAALLLIARRLRRGPAQPSGGTDATT